MNGKLWEIIRSLVVAAVIGIVVMYGTVAKISAKVDMVEWKVDDVRNQLFILTGLFHQHVIDYSIHVPHKDLRGGKGMEAETKSYDAEERKR